MSASGRISYVSGYFMIFGFWINKEKSDMNIYIESMIFI